MCREDAADIVQQVFLVVHTKIDEFRRDRPGDSFRGWLFGILRNHLRHHYRNAARRPMPAGGTDALQRLNEVAAVDDPSTFSTEGLSDLCRRALEFIQAEYEQTTWMAFWRTAVEGKLPRDVAAELGLTVNAVYVARSRVVRRLREFLSENEA
jgi:RNA polymerase sigma-70 factor (ECF subfamily)